MRAIVHILLIFTLLVQPALAGRPLCCAVGATSSAELSEPACPCCQGSGDPAEVGCQCGATRMPDQTPPIPDLGAPRIEFLFASPTLELGWLMVPVLAEPGSPVLECPVRFGSVSAQSLLCVWRT